MVKYGIYIFIGGWMFLLGIMVGRGNAPVSFDTRGFQDRLAAIAREYGNASQAGQRVELEVYEAGAATAPDILERKIKPRKPFLIGKSGTPGQGTRDGISDQVVQKSPDQAPLKKRQKILAKEVSPSQDAKEVIVVKDEKVEAVKPITAETHPSQSWKTVPHKTGRKAATLNRSALAHATDSAPKSRVSQKPALKQNQGPSPAGHGSGRQITEDKPLPSQATGYTIQVASYKALGDALTQMALLDKKGFSSQRTEKKIKDTVWHRVRCGPFETRKEAETFLEKLNKARFNGLIIKKE